MEGEVLDRDFCEFPQGRIFGFQTVVSQGHLYYKDNWLVVGLSDSSQCEGILCISRLVGFLFHCNFLITDNYLTALPDMTWSKKVN